MQRLSLSEQNLHLNSLSFSEAFFPLSSLTESNVNTILLASLTLVFPQLTTTADLLSCSPQFPVKLVEGFLSKPSFRTKRPLL